MKYAYKGKEIFPIVEIYHDIIPYLANITEKEFYLDPVKCANAWKKSNPIVADYFGELLPPRKPSAPPLSYGHLVCLGAPLNIPEDSEPNISHFARDIDEGIAILKEKQGMDFSDTDIFRHYKMMNTYLQQEMPDENISFGGLGYEGVITSAELIRGQDFFCDIMDEPEKVHEYLSLMNESIIDFIHFTRRYSGLPEMSAGGGLADDFASIIPPNMWPEFVVPYWNRYFEGISTGKSRYVHCENTYPEQLKYLKDAKITRYQPSVADRLTIENIRANTEIPFDWLLYAYHVAEMSDTQIEEWVDRTVEAGITSIRTQFGRYAWENGRMDRILAFYKAFEKYRED